MVLLNVTADNTDTVVGPVKSMLDDANSSTRKVAVAVDLWPSIHLPRVNMKTYLPAGTSK